MNTTREPRLRSQEEVDKGEDTIHVYKDGYKIEYNGVRGWQGCQLLLGGCFSLDPETFVSWLMDVKWPIYA